jgi:DNA-binding CsgD family transcriptional regulator
MGRRVTEDEKLIDFIGRIYDAALNEELWPGVAPRLAHLFDSPSAALQIKDAASGSVEIISSTSNLNPSAMEEYRKYYCNIDIWHKRAAAVGLSRVLASDDLIADSELERTEFWQDWCRKIDQFYIVGSVLSLGGGAGAALGIHRPRASGEFDLDHKAAVARLLPHVERALQIRRHLARMATERRASLEALERTGTATLVVLGDARLIYASPGAESFLRQGDAIRLLNGRLVATGRECAQQLRYLIRGSAATAADGKGDAGGAVRIERPNRLPLTILVAPFRPSPNRIEGAVPAAILFIKDPEWPTVRSGSLQELFGLTSAESTLVSALAEGKSVTEFALDHRISVNTVRTQLKSAFSKTGTSRQAELVALCFRSVSCLG